jgi:hypothetical protein
MPLLHISENDVTSFIELLYNVMSFNMDEFMADGTCAGIGGPCADTEGPCADCNGGNGGGLDDNKASRYISK